MAIHIQQTPLDLHNICVPVEKEKLGPPFTLWSAGAEHATQAAWHAMALHAAGPLPW